MFKKTSDRPFMPVGICLLLVSFSIVVVAILSVMVLSTANSNKTFTDVSFNSIYDYYKADTCAEEILANIRSNNIDSSIVFHDGNVYKYSIKIDNMQSLSVVVERVKNVYLIKQWKVVRISEWNPDETINVFRGD